MYDFLGSAGVTSVGSHASFRSGVVGSFPLYVPSAFRARRLFGAGLLLSILCLLHHLIG